MGKPRNPNEIEVAGEVSYIILRRANGSTLKAPIDTSDILLVKSTEYAWYAGLGGTAHTFYVRDRFGRLLHRLLMNCPKGMQIDHRDHNGLNNQRNNLFISTLSKNRLNQVGVQKGTRSKLRGVTWHRGKWRARVMLDGKEKVLGYFEHKEDASEVVENFLLIHLGKQRYKAPQKILRESKFRRTLRA
jgi:hypothetical protein